MSGISSDVLIVDSIGFILLGGDLAFESIISGAGICFTVGYTVPVLIVSKVSMPVYHTLIL